jgi:hypothetical protein
VRIDAYAPYAPLQTVKAFANDVWVVDGPEIDFRYLGINFPFPTRMTIVALTGGELWVHSPIAWSDDLGVEIAKLGSVSHLIAPNTLHYWYMPDWQKHFPQARSYGPPGLADKARRPISIDETLGEQPPAQWDGVFNQCLIRGSLLTEVDFFHRPSRTLILTDLIENFELSRVRGALLRWLIKTFGAADPDGKAPFDMQLSFLGKRRNVRAAAELMIKWAPERIVIAHGRCYEAQTVEELRRAFRWVL